MKKALIGYGGHAKEVSTITGINVFFVEDEYACANTEKLSNLNIDAYQVMIAIGDPIIRKKIANKLPKETTYFSYIHPTSLVLNNIAVGIGSYIGPYCILTTNIKIGKHSILNRSNQIGHDTITKDYLTMMPGSIISGSCSIGECFYLGTNASVKEKITIVDDVTVGLNSGVVKNILVKGTYGGLPSKLIK